MPYLAYLETYPANVTVSCLIRLARALQTTPEALLGAAPAVKRPAVRPNVLARSGH